MPLIKPTDKAITKYLATRKALAAQHVSDKLATHRASHPPRAKTVKLHGGTSVPVESTQTVTATVYPSAVLRDKDTLPRGFLGFPSGNLMDGAKVLRKLRSGHNVTVCGTWNPSVFPIVKLRLVPDFVTGTNFLWSIGIYRGRKCIRRWPALSPEELAQRLYGLEVCDD